MKQKIERTNPSTKRFSTRTIAMVLSIVMLIGSIATGSMLSTFAAYLDNAAQADAVTQAAAQGGDIALNAIPSEDNADEAEAKPDLSGLEENEIVRGIKDDLADTGADVGNLAATGYSKAHFYLQDSSGSAVTDQEINLSGSNEGTFTYSALDNYQGLFMRFYITADNDQFGIDNTSTTKNYVTNGSNFNLAKGNVSTSGYYGYYKVGDNATSVTFGFDLDESGTISVTETSSVTGWYIIGGSEWTPWSKDNTNYPLTETSTGIFEKEVTITGTGNTYFRVHNGSKQYNISNSNDTQVTSTYQNLAEGSTKALYLTAGEYTITVDATGSTKKIKATPIIRSTVSVTTDEHATATATYGTTTAISINNVREGETVTINVTPATGYEVDTVTTTPQATVTQVANRATFAMPNTNTTVNVTTKKISAKTVYFNNYKTKYSKVFAYAYDKNGDIISRTPLGPNPGTAMTKLDNSCIWAIDVPGDITYIVFTGDDGYNTGELEIPKTDSVITNNSQYNPGNDRTTPATGGSWGTYVKRTNIYAVNPGSTIQNKSNIFTGITATFFDYHYDTEITGGWISGITADDYNKEWDPYTHLNKALSDYAKNYTTDVTTDDITYPLYFGILDKADTTDDLVKNYHNFIHKVNNANGLGHLNNALTGLSGTSMSGSTIHHYKSGATDENGAPMALFDEDFLTDQNTAASNGSSEVLATVLHSSAFPVRKTTEGKGELTTKIYLDKDGWGSSDNPNIDAYFFNNDNGFASWAEMSEVTISGHAYYVCDIPESAKQFHLIRRDPSKPRKTWKDIWNRYDNISVEASGSSLKNYYKITFGDNGTQNLTSGKKTSFPGYSNHATGHVYYEYDSTGGKDNAFITDINTANQTAKINYYTDKKISSNQSHYGFFPFDYNNVIGHKSTISESGYGGNSIANDLGFGVKLEIPFTLNANGINDDGTHQEFKFSGDDDLWVFVDNQLVLDLGGAHAATSGKIDFANRTVTATMTEPVSNATRNASFSSSFDNTNPNTMHTMTIYYMERGMNDSNLKFGFSFHAIPNRFNVEKKVRTNEINPGFYDVNTTTGATTSGGAPILNDKGKPITWFENSYQNEQFTVQQQYAGNLKNPQQFIYSIGSTNYTLTSGTDFSNKTINYTPLKNDQIAYSLGQFEKNQLFTLKETDYSTGNKYNYSPSLTVYDDANVDTATKKPYAFVSGTATETGKISGNNTDGYQFMFKETHPISADFENLNIRATFENTMLNHNLVIRKVTDVNDPSSTFTFTVKWKCGTEDYIAYPLYCTVDGTDTKLTTDGKITVKSGQLVMFHGIPENAEVQITETAVSEPDYRFAGASLIYSDNSAFDQTSTTVTKGIQFTMGTKDTVATISNKKTQPYIDVTYSYPAYLTKYGTEKYNIHRLLKSNERKNYFNVNDDGSIEFKDDTAKTNFINFIAPYEDNFMNTISWNTTDATAVYIPETDTFDIDVVHNVEDRNLNISLKLPYANSGNTQSDGVYFKPTESSGKIAYVSSPVETPVTATTTKCFNWLSFNDYKTYDQDPEGTNAAFLKAPMVVYDDSTPMIFRYWSVKNATSGTNYVSKEYTKCYYNQFNLTLYQDSILEPVYTAASQAEAQNLPTDADAEKLAQMNQHSSNDGVQITFIENSRNQYNLENAFHTGNARIGGDRIYTDFLLSFNNATLDNQQLNLYAQDTYTCGIIIEKAGMIDETGVEQNEDGFIAAYGADAADAVKKNANSMSVSDLQTYAANNVKPAGKTVVAIRSTFDAKNLDNKNRIKYFYSLANKQDGTLKELNNKNLVYRAYAYIMPTGGSAGQVVLSAKPVYFTINEISNYQY